MPLLIKLARLVITAINIFKDNVEVIRAIFIDVKGYLERHYKLIFLAYIR